MAFWFAACAMTFAAGGLAAGLYLACRFSWPREVYELLFTGRA